MRRPSQIVVSYSLFCSCGMWVGYCNSRVEAYRDALRERWQRDRKRGWICPECQKGNDSEQSQG